MYFKITENSITIKVESDVETKMHPELYKLKNNYDLSLPFNIESKNQFIGFTKGWFPNVKHDSAVIEIAQEALEGMNNNVLDFYIN